MNETRLLIPGVYQQERENTTDRSTNWPRHLALHAQGTGRERGMGSGAGRRGALG